MRWSLRNDDDDGSENGKRAIGLDKQNNVARASRFFVHFSAVAARLLRARGGGVLPYMGYMGMCRCEGYGIQTGHINQSVWV